MNDRKRRDDRSPEHRAAEGVRIIGAEEAQAALEAGHAAGRRAEDELRFGDVPPQPAGPRPPHRFPLPDSVDPANAVPRPPLAAPRRGDERSELRARPVDPDAAHDPSPWQERGLTRSGEAAGDPVGGDPAGGDPASGSAPEAAGPAPAAPLPEASLGSDDPTGRLFLPPPGEDAGAGSSAGGAPAPADRPGDPLDEAWSDYPDRRDPEPAHPDPGAAWEAPEPPAGAPGWQPSSGSAGWEPSPATSAWQAPDPGGAGGWEPGPSWVVDPRPPAWEPPAWEPPSGDAAAGDPPTWSPPPGDPPALTPQPADPTVVVGAASEDEPAPDRPPAEEGITMSGGTGTELPHWTDPPTGEVPRILADEGPGTSEEDDLAAWHALGSRGTRWREGDDWDEDDDLGAFADDETRVGALDQTRAEHSDLYSFDEDFDRLEEERTGGHPVAGAAALGDPTVRAPRRPRPEPRGGGRSTGRRRDDLASRVAVGVGLTLLLLIAYAIDPKALLVLAAAVVLAAAAEGYGMLQRAGFRPATLLGLVGSVALMFAAYWRGTEALPLAVVMVLGGSMLWYLLRIVDARPLANVAVTLTTFVWIGVLGAFGAVMLRAPHGSGLFLGAVATAVAADIGAYVVGRWIGSRPLAPHVSPAKTIEGFLGGLVLALVVGAIVGKELTPWGGGKHGLLLGLVIGVLAPIGDLFESMVKRDLNLKDSGSALAAHGGLLDRFDGVLVALPAAYYLAFWLNLVK